MCFRIDRARRDHGVEGQQAQGWWAIDQDVVINDMQFRQRVTQPELATLSIDKLAFRTREFD